ncbi:HU family DNA-binding protein [Ostreiculturibacter nitratireducens]|uniref:HU family DNA-binding protein n=1 Tax=Ostreiculturibacter nitratireducens TaxID=3075226 RepID=UPI0031B58D67
MKSPAASNVINVTTATAETSDGAAKALRKKEFLDRVIAETGAKKKDAKAVVDATLKLLGDALAAGETLVLPPFGKAKVNRQKHEGETLLVKLRRGAATNSQEKSGKEALAEADE